MDDDAREKKLARNEYLLKRLNQRIDELTTEFAEDGLAPDRDSAQFFCACGSADCDARIKLRLSEYERIRAFEHRFIVIPGHEHPDLERVVETHPSYLVVEKLPEYRNTT